MEIIDNIENTIVQSLLYSLEYFTRAFTNLDESHFDLIENKELFKSIKQYYSEYQEKPSFKEIGLSIKNIKQEKLRTLIIDHFKAIYKADKSNNITFLIDETEKYVQRQKFKEALIKGAEAIQQDGDLNPIYGMMEEALKISFDSNVGLEYSNLEHRLEYYKKVHQRYSTGIKELDEILGGGFQSKTLNIPASQAGGGKSAFLAHYTAHRTMLGDDSIFYTLEMSEEEISKRVDANILDIDSNLFRTTPNEVFEKKYNDIKDKLGTLVVKEFPAGTLDVLKIENHINEFIAKYGRKPKFICIDYLTLMKSTRATIAKVGGYAYYKLIAEEVRALCMKYDIYALAPQQINRSGYNNKDAGMENVSDSIGIAQTADTFFIVSRSAELDSVGQVIFNFVKNRNTGTMAKALIGIDWSKMRFYDINMSETKKEDIKMTINNFDDDDFGFNDNSMFL